MPGTPSFTAVTGDPTSNLLTLHLIDASGDLWTESFQIDDGEPAAEIQSFVTAYQAATNASVWNVTRTAEWRGDPDPNNALALYRAGVQNGINMLFRNPDNFARDLRLVAPIAAVMQGNQDIPLVSATEMAALITAYLAIQPTFDLETAQYTARRERRNNPRIRI